MGGNHQMQLTANTKSKLSPLGHTRLECKARNSDPPDIRAVD